MIQYKYDPFDATQRGLACGGRVGYQEDTAGYKLLGDRWYDPEVGRFLTRDKAHDGRNWYAYCDNGPTTRCDPTGQITMTELLPGPPGGIGSGKLWSRPPSQAFPTIEDMLPSPPKVIQSPSWPVAVWAPEGNLDNGDYVSIWLLRLLYGRHIGGSPFPGVPGLWDNVFGYNYWDFVRPELQDDPWFGRIPLLNKPKKAKE